MELDTARRLYDAGTISGAQVVPAAMQPGTWAVLFVGVDFPDPHLERTRQAGGGLKTFRSLDRAVAAAGKIGVGRVSVVLEPSG